MYRGSVFVYLCQSHDSLTLNLKEQTSGVCLRGYKYSRSRMLTVYTHSESAVCGDAGVSSHKSESIFDRFSRASGCWLIQVCPHFTV